MNYLSPTLHIASPFVFNRNKFAFGDQISIWCNGYHHIGTVNYDGRVYAASYKFGCVRLNTLQEFAGDYGVENIVSNGHRGPLSRLQVIQNYEQLIGEPYNVLTKNCEHYDYFARGMGWQSPQLKEICAAVSVIAIGALAFTATRSSKVAA